MTEHQPTPDEPEPIRSIITLSGMTCSGKSTLANKLVETGYFGRVVTATTRAPRQLKQGHERNGIDYFFVTDQEFDNWQHTNKLLESTHFSGFRYGTPLSSVESVISDNRIPLVVIDPEGAATLKHRGRRAGFDVISVFLSCDIRTALSRLKDRQARDQEHDDHYYERRINALTCEETAWASRLDWDLTLHQFTDENIEWQLELLLHSCKDGERLAGSSKLSELTT